MIRTLAPHLLSWRLAPWLLWSQLLILLWLQWQGWPHAQLAWLLPLLLGATLWLGSVYRWQQWRQRELARRAQALADGGLAERLPQQGRDALAQLAASCNVIAAQLQAARLGLDQGRHFADMLLQGMPLPVFYKDVHGRYLGCNEAFGRVTGLSPRAIRGRSAEELWGKQLAALHQHHDAALLRGEARQDYPGELRDRNGQRRQVIFSKNVFYDDDGKVAGIIGAWNDISELREAEERLRMLAGVFKHSREGIAITDQQIGRAHV